MSNNTNQANSSLNKSFSEENRKSNHFGQDSSKNSDDQKSGEFLIMRIHSNDHADKDKKSKSSNSSEYEQIIGSHEQLGEHIHLKQDHY